MLRAGNVILRRIENADLWQLWQWHEEKELYLFEALKEFITWDLLNENFSKHFGWKGDFIAESTRGETLGVCSYGNVNLKNRTAELDLECPGPAITLAADIIGILLGVLFEEMGMSRVYSSVPDFDLSKQQAFEAAGLAPEGVLREAVYHDGEYHNILTYGILREEFGREVP